MRREDVKLHSYLPYGGPPYLPAVNVKVHFPIYGSPEWAKLAEQVARAEGDEGNVQTFVGFVESDRWNDDEGVLFGFVCEDAFGLFQNDVRGETEFHTMPNGAFPGYDVKLEVAGRSGGWIVVHGLPPVEEWDTILLRQWEEFEKLARSYADDVPWGMLASLYINEFERQVLDPASAADHPCGYCPACGTPVVSGPTFGSEV